MKTFITVISMAALLSLSNTGYSQSLKLGFGGGLTIIQSPDGFTNSIPDGAGFDSEYHIGLKVKIDLPIIPITPYGFIQYHFLRGEGSTPLGTVETNQNIFSLGAGGELELVPGPINPFLLLDLSYNNFGDFEASGGSLSISSGGNSRVGLGIGAGVAFTLLPIDLELSAKYNFFNLVGKEDGEETISAFVINASVFFGS